MLRSTLRLPPSARPELRLLFRRPLGVLVLLAALCLSACQTTIGVGVDVRDNGSGVVTVTAHLDSDAAANASDVRTSDLVDAGWKVVGPTPTAGGGVDFAASKAFANPSAARAVIAELSGPAGPFRDLVVASHSSFFETTTTFGGTVDLKCGLKCFSDPQLQQALGGASDLGIDPSELQANAGVTLDRLFQFEVAARLPGTVLSSNAPTRAGNSSLWRVGMGQKAVVLATSRARNMAHIVVAAVVAVAVLAALVVLVVLLVKRWRRRHRRAHKKS